MQGSPIFIIIWCPTAAETQFKTQTLAEAPVLYYAVPGSVHKSDTQ